MDSLSYTIVGINIRNFMGLERVDIDFTQNGDPRKSFPIFGGQGAGKSTIIRAIQWCAYGTEETGRLTREGILPKSWGGKVLEDQSVMVRFRPNSATSTASDDVYCTRIRKKGNLNTDSITYKDEVEDYNDKASASKAFKRIFGKRPAIGVGTMWVIRSEEMKKVAKSISKNEETYFLEFMNMETTKDSLTEVIAKLTKKETEAKISGSNANNLRVLKEEAEQKVIEQRKKIELMDSTRQEIKRWLLENSPDDAEIEQAGSKEAFDAASLKYQQNSAGLKEVQLTQDETNDLVNALLFSALNSKDVEIPTAHERDKFDWSAIADYCATTKLFKSEVIERLRSLNEGLGFDTSGMKTSRPSEFVERISLLKESIKEYYISEERVEEYKENGIDADSVLKAFNKSKNHNNKKIELNKLREEIGIEKLELDSLKQQHKDYENRYIGSVDSGSIAERVSKKLTIARAIHTAISETDEEYMKETFSEMISSVKKYWERIDQDGKYVPELRDGINLMNKKDGTLMKISTDNDGNASGGESQLLLVCICLALAENSGSKMPIILDDCFTEVDKPTRKALVKVVCESFDSMIFVTNDQDKASLMEEYADGTLKLHQWGDDRTSVNEKDWNEWKVWI